MARPLRISYEGAFYHVTARRNERKKIFLSRTDYEKFLSYLTDALHKYGVILHCYVLMANYYHLIVETRKANLSTFMLKMIVGKITPIRLKNHTSFGGKFSCPSTFRSGTIIMVAVPWPKRFPLAS